MFLLVRVKYMTYRSRPLPRVIPRLLPLSVLPVLNSNLCSPSNESSELSNNSETTIMSFLRTLFSTGPVVPVIRLEGVIQAGRSGGIGASRSINMANTAKMIDRAFSFSRSPAVALVINSPGGSAAQSHLVARRIRKLSEEKKKPVLAFVEDAAASGGYILALAADEIYGDPFSIIGSIGVIHASFGFTEAIKKIGVERRVETAGKNKSFMDPFSERDEEDKERLKIMLDSMHDKFKSFVKERRGSKLKQPDNVLFEGDFWLSDKAMDFGLIDGIGDVRSIIKSKYGANVLMPLVQPRPSIFSIGDLSLKSAVSDISDQFEHKDMWGKYGL